MRVPPCNEHTRRPGHDNQQRTPQLVSISGRKKERPKNLFRLITRLLVTALHRYPPPLPNRASTSCLIIQRSALRFHASAPSSLFLHHLPLQFMFSLILLSSSVLGRKNPAPHRNPHSVIVAYKVDGKGNSRLFPRLVCLAPSPASAPTNFPPARMPPVALPYCLYIGCDNNFDLLRKKRPAHTALAQGFPTRLLLSTTRAYQGPRLAPPSLPRAVPSAISFDSLGIVSNRCRTCPPFRNPRNSTIGISSSLNFIISLPLRYDWSATL